MPYCENVVCGHDVGMCHAGMFCMGLRMRACGHHGGACVDRYVGIWACGHVVGMWACYVVCGGHVAMHDDEGMWRMVGMWACGHVCMWSCVGTWLGGHWDGLDILYSVVGWHVGM